MDEWDFDDRRRSSGKLADEIQGMLPDRAGSSPAARRSKLPFKVELLSGALIWRVHELARATLAAYDAQMHVAGILIARGGMETVAKLDTLQGIVASHQSLDLADLDERLMKGIFGARNRKDRPSSGNVMGDIDRVSKRFPAFRAIYDELSEYAHPNDSGTASAFSRLGLGGSTALFTPLGENPRRRAWTLIEALDITLLLAVTVYSDLCRELPHLARTCDDDAQRRR